MANHVPIAQLEPTSEPDYRSAAGIVTLIWPYSSSQNSYGLLLVEPDFRLRRRKGQVRLNFTGGSAKAVARAGIKSGDQLLLNLQDAQWARDDSQGKTPGKGIDWELRFGERAVLQIQREGEDPVLIDVDHPPVSPQARTSPPPVAQSSPPLSASVSVFGQTRPYLNSKAQAWSSPAFLKRKAPSSTPYLNSIYDPFGDEGDHRESSPTKRTKFGRKSIEWRFADRTPSPILEPGTLVEDQVEEEAQKQIEEESRHLALQQQQKLPSPAPTPPAQSDEQALESIMERWRSPNSGRTQEQDDPQCDDLATQRKATEIQVDRLDQQIPEKTNEGSFGKSPEEESLQEQRKAERSVVHKGPEAGDGNFGIEGTIPQESHGYAELDRTVTSISVTDAQTDVSDTTKSGPQLPYESTNLDEADRGATDSESLFKGPEDTVIDKMHDMEEDQHSIFVDDEEEEEEEEEGSGVGSNDFSERSNSLIQQEDEDEDEDELYYDEELADSEVLSGEEDEHHDQTQKKDAAPEVIELSSSSPAQVRSSHSPPSKESGLYYEENNERGIGDILEDDDEEEEEAEVLQQQMYYDDDMSGDEYMSEEDFEDLDEAEDVEDYGEEEGSEAASSDSDLIMMDGPPNQTQQARLPIEPHDPDESLYPQEHESSSEGGIDGAKSTHRFGYDGSTLSRLIPGPESRTSAAEPELAVQTAPISDTVGYIDKWLTKGNPEPTVPATVDRSLDIQTKVEEDEQSDRTSILSATQHGLQQLQQAASDPEPSSSQRPLKKRATPNNERPNIASSVPSAQDSPIQHRDELTAHTTREAVKSTKESDYIAASKQLTKPHDASIKPEVISVDVHYPSHDDVIPALSVNANIVARREDASIDEENESGEELEEMTRSEAGDYWSEEDHMSEEAEFTSEFEELQPSEEGEEGEEDEDIEDVEEENDEPVEMVEKFDNALGRVSEVKRSAVEIIDLENDEDEEPAVPNDTRTQEATPLYPELPQSRLQEYDTTVVEQEVKQEETKYPKLSKAQPQTALGADNNKVLVRDKLEQSTVEERDIVLISAKREIHDTYSEDAGFTEDELPDAQLLSQEKQMSLPIEPKVQTSPNAGDPLQAQAEFDPPLSHEERKISHDHAKSVGTRESTPVSSISIQRANSSSEKAGSDLIQTQVTMRAFKPLSQEIPDSEIEYRPTKVPDEMAPLDPDGDENHKQIDEDDLLLLVNDSDDEPIQELSLQDLREELEHRSQLPTPTTTQVTKIRSEPSDVPSQYEAEEIGSEEVQHETLPTPSLTQKTSEIPARHTLELPAEKPPDMRTQEAPNKGPSDISIAKGQELIPPATPAPSRKVSMIEKMKEMRSESAKKRRASLIQDTPSAVNAWFGPSRSSQLVTETDHDDVQGVEEETGRDGDVSSEVERDSELDNELSLPRTAGNLAEIPSGRLPSSSPPPTPMEQKTGFRTSLSYFAPLASLRSLYNSTTSILALVIASTPVKRATSGPKDHHMTLYITDPSSSSPPLVTLARIFRPSKLAFPAPISGDAILLRNFRVVSYRRKLILLSTESSAWALFRKGEEPQIKGPPVEFGAEERGFVRGLWDWWATVDHELFLDSVPREKLEGKSSEMQSSRKTRSSVLRHELRDGTSYVDPGKRDGSESVHELRDGTRWSDSKL